MTIKSIPFAGVATLVSLAMVAFAANSVLCRLALLHTNIDPASFTSIRLISGAVVLWILLRTRPTSNTSSSTIYSALALFIYAAGFSYAYTSLSAASGALLLFGAVQTTMIGYAIRSGEKLSARHVLGLVIALCGLIILLYPGVSAPSLEGSLLMITSGVAWGAYCLMGKTSLYPMQTIAADFSKAVPFALILSVFVWDKAELDMIGVWYAIASGALASGIGYALWYAALPMLNTTSAATVQLSVPVIAAIGGAIVLDETLTIRLAVATVTILGGIALVTYARKR